jgi:hypothetical protein
MQKQSTRQKGIIASAMRIGEWDAALTPGSFQRLPAAGTIKLAVQLHQTNKAAAG